MIAGDDAISVTHQHGCAMIGDDVEHTASVFTGMATNPNVAGVLVVGLGCETIQGSRIADRIGKLGQLVRYVGIQADGGMVNTVANGTALLHALRAEVAEGSREDGDADQLIIGLDDSAAPFAESLREIAARAGARVIVADDQAGAEQHPDLATAGAQIIVAWCGPGEGPRGFAICPVVSVSGDSELFAALSDDFDVDGTDRSTDVAETVWQEVLRVFNGSACAAELRGARDFYLRRAERTL
jgi:altronate dehydratase